jgi:hypothetical protein
MATEAPPKTPSTKTVKRHTQKRTALELYGVTLSDVKKSKAWFDKRTQYLSTKKITPNRLMVTEEGDKLTWDLSPGKLFSFYYMPKHAETLPYYDTFPMVFPFDRDKDGFIGLNMHYLDYQPRFALFRELLKTNNSRYLTEQSRLSYNWSLIKNVSKMAPAKACVKRYLFSHVKSPFLEFSPKDWPTAMTLPVERFVKANKTQVWMDSNKYR